VAYQSLLTRQQQTWHRRNQALFRRIEHLAGAQMPDGYTCLPQLNDVATAVLSKSTWAVMALTLDIELFTQLHYRESIDPDTQLSDLFKDVFLFHWKEESQHAIMDELEWKRHDATLCRSNAIRPWMNLSSW
jgi:hypothetical protein